CERADYIQELNEYEAKVKATEPNATNSPTEDG
ncbi:ROK family protein, partial [Listeria monocytogenes]